MYTCNKEKNHTSGELYVLVINIIGLVGRSLHSAGLGMTECLGVCQSTG